MDDLKSTTNLVKQILESVPPARNSDMLLYYRVAEQIGWKNGIDILSKPFGYVLLSLKDYGLPAFESVRRTRQKIQAAHPELAGDSKTEAYRKLNEKTYRDYARNVRI